MKKITFNDKYGLTLDVLEGKKTQTRRIATRQQLLTILGIPKFADYNMDELAESCAISCAKSRFSPFVVGEEVAIAQSYDDIYMEKNVPCPIPEEFRLNAFNKGFNHGHKGWRNKMFVSPVDMPFRIKITNVRIEHLQDISEDDCLKEGVAKTKWEHSDVFYYTSKATPHRYNLAKDAFSSLIDKVSGKGTWDSNPWVFVYDFELIK